MYFCPCLLSFAPVVGVEYFRNFAGKVCFCVFVLEKICLALISGAMEIALEWII
jgi:hypothetical protein